MEATYRYALNKFGKVQDVTTLSRTDVAYLEPFVCVGCQGRLIAKLGQKMIKHFAHANGQGCAGETYLHNLGKRAFLETYTNCLDSGKSFNLELETEVICTHFENKLDIHCSEFRKISYDLTSYFDSVILECEHEGFVPDILLKSSTTKEVLYVEIAVTHKTSEEKRSSGHRIIEYVINSEDDIYLLKETFISGSNNKIKLYNFNAQPMHRDVCNGNCQKEFRCFVIDYKGIASVIKSTPESIVQKINNNSVVRASLCVSNDKIKSDFYDFVHKANADGVHIRSCYVCNNVKYEKNDDKIFCQKRLKYVPSFEAFRCSSFFISKISHE